MILLFLPVWLALTNTSVIVRSLHAENIPEGRYCASHQGYWLSSSKDSISTPLVKMFQVLLEVPLRSSNMAAFFVPSKVFTGRYLHPSSPHRCYRCGRHNYQDTISTQLQHEYVINHKLAKIYLGYESIFRRRAIRFIKFSTQEQF